MFRRSTCSVYEFTVGYVQAYPTSLKFKSLLNIVMTLLENEHYAF